MKNLLYISLLLLPVTLFSQGVSRGVLFASNAENSSNIIVKLLVAEAYHPNGFDLYRKSDNSDWTKINSSAIQLNQNANVSGFDEESRQLYKAITGSTYAEFSTSMARAFLLIKAIYNNDFAKVIGICYEDNSSKEGTIYQYKITLHDDSKEIAVTEDIVCGAFQNQFSPTDAILERKKTFVSLSWQPDVFNYYGVDIYRKEIEESEFKKITIHGPIAVDIKSQKKYKTSDIFFKDTLIDNDKSYIYKLVSINYLGQQSKYSEEYKVPVKDFIPPATPYTFKVRPYSVEQYAKLTWEAIEESDLAGFNIYSSQDPEGTFQKINTNLLDKSVRSFDAKGLPVGGHYFIVSAVDQADNESTTGMMFGEVRDVEPPLAPQNLTSKAESGKITLSWKANAEGDLLGYIVQKSLSDSNNLDNFYVQLNKEIIKDAVFEIKLSKNVQNKFVYRILALDTLYNTSKPSINSMAQMPDVTPPQNPVLSGINIEPESNNLIIKWILNVDQDLEGYQLLRKSKGDSTFAKVNYTNIPKDVTQYMDRTTEEGENYIYVLQAIDNSGNLSSYSNEFSYTKKKSISQDKVEVVKSQYNARKKEVSIEWKWSGEESPKGYVVYSMSDEGILKPYTGLMQNTELKIKMTLELKKTFEIRSYTMNGEIIKSELFIIEGTKI
jgi:hypothetical protein